MKKHQILILLIIVAVAALISSNERAVTAQVTAAQVASQRAQTAHAAATRASDGVNVSPAVPAKTQAGDKEKD